MFLYKKHRLTKEEDRYAILEKAREKYWGKIKGKSIGPEPGPSNQAAGIDEDEEDVTEFTRRAPNLKKNESLSKSSGNTSSSKASSGEYCPGKSSLISPIQRVNWGIKDEDYFTIYFEEVSDLLDLFKDSLETSGLEPNTALQHKNQIENIWGTIDSEMKMYPINSLANVHKFRDFYHAPIFKNLGKRGHIQAGTLRARYVSLGFFLQFVRKYQIFAGMNRMQIQILEQSVNDFNKDLHPLIQQRKVEVRKMKRRNLLTALHFINFGQSKFVQDLIKRYHSKKTATFSTGFAVDFRNYLITSLVIGNGLRASNIIQLKLSDFERSTKAPEYAGHNIIVNDNYKTSTIYGEKFIVVPDELLDHFFFYVKNLRSLIYSGTAKKAFVTSGDGKQMSQTNVASSLTAAFKKANVFNSGEYQRVSCTRIRCGLATFACNEGGMETAYVANHFMKNKEETTALHYNLHANRRHALHIAMKLYDSFNMPDGEKVVLQPEELKKCFMQTQRSKKESTIQWLKSHDSSITPAEVKEFEDALDEYEVFKPTDSFYGKSNEV